MDVKAVFWVAVGVALLYYTDLLRKCMEDQRVNRWVVQDWNIRF